MRFTFKSHPLLWLLILGSVSLVDRANAVGSSFSICSNTIIDAQAEQYGYIVSDSYPNSYGYWMSCYFEIDVPNPRYQYIAMRTIEWNFDQSYNDRLTVWANTNGWWEGGWTYWQWNGGDPNGFRSAGHLRFSWWTDGWWGYWWMGTPRWKIAWTLQPYLFGCELNPQPYIFPNTSKYGVLKSPYFPDRYPVNAYCQTIIDVDQAVDLIEFTPVMFLFQTGDVLYFYTGDSQLNNWVLYSAFSSSNIPQKFRIYGTDVKIIFNSDYYASSNGYQIYWRVISKERYPVYKADQLQGFWPLTMAHRGIDLSRGCNTPEFPTAGTITPIFGPFGNAGSGLFFQKAYLNMTTPWCINSTTITGSYTLSVFLQTAASGPVVEYLLPVGNSVSWGLHFWANPGYNIWGSSYVNKTDQVVQSSASNPTNWIHASLRLDTQTGIETLFADNVKKAQASCPVGMGPPAALGFLFGHRDNRCGGEILPQARFTCLTLYSTALSNYDIGQVRAMCEKFQRQYEIFPGESLIGWWPMTDIPASAIMRDVSGNGLHGVVNSATYVTLTTGPTGAANGAYNFNGNMNAYATVSYPMTMLKSFTISFFIKAQSSSDSLIEFIGPGNTRGLTVILKMNTMIDFYLKYAGGIRYESSLPTNLYTYWGFVTFTYEAATGVVTNWLNGTVLDTWTTTQNYQLGTSSSGFYVMQRGGGGTVTGSMACLSLYKTALTADQIAQVMAACVANFNQPAAMVDVLGFWPLTNLTGFDDISGNHFNGTAMSDNVTLATGPFGVPNTAYEIGVEQYSYINVPGADLNLGFGSYTISFYVKYLTPNSGPILEYLGSSNALGAMINIHIWGNNPGTNWLYVNTIGCQIQATGLIWNQWQFFSLAYDSTTLTSSLYREGSLLGSCNGMSNATSVNGFNIGYRAADQTISKFLISCLSIYKVALSQDGIGRVMSMCQSFLMDQALRDQTKVPEINCNFDGGFCGWSQATDDHVDWELGHDNTPTGQPLTFYTGPRVGKSAERMDALDQYALINTAAIGSGGYRARLLSPGISEGWHCFSMWYFMGGGNCNLLNVLTVNGNFQLLSLSGNQGKQWFFFAASFYLSTADLIAIDGYTGSTNIYSDIAIDDIKVTDGKCAGTNPCPRGWLDYGRKCFLNMAPYANTPNSGNTGCKNNLRARMAVPEDPGELTFLQSVIGASTIYVNAYLTGGAWKTVGVNYPLAYLPWASGQPGAGSYVTLTSAGFSSSAGATNLAFFCEVTKLEMQHLGFNCTFDNKHLCGWKNQQTDSTDPSNGGATLDIDVWSGLSLPWQNEYLENGPEWDWNVGNTRGYYAMLADSAIPTCSNYYSFLFSPLMVSTGRSQCLRFRTYRTTNVAKIQIYLWRMNAAGTITYGPAVTVTGNTGLQWHTFQLEINENIDFYQVVFQISASCNSGGLGNQIIDDVMLFDSTCSIPLYQSTSGSALNSNRPQPNAQDGSDSLGDNNFLNPDDQYFPWRDLPSDSTNWGCYSGAYPTGFRRTGPQSDYTGEGNYLSLDFGAYYMTGVAKFTGPPVPSGQKCFIFHYFMHGYDVGELRVSDGNGRYLFARQNSQGPSWKEHRILLSGTSPTSLVFEGSSGQSDGNSHNQKYHSIQLDDIYTRNGTDLCLGFLDCDFDRSSYLTDCGWLQNDTDDADWVRNSGETPAGNANTGPTSDHSTGLGHYLYFDATGHRAGATARIHMPPIPAGNFCLTFYYYMWGQDIGILRVFYLLQTNMQNTVPFFTAYKENNLWIKYGQQGNFWIRAMVPIQLTYPQILTFEALRGNGDRGDIAIDDVVLLEGACPNDRSLSCSFERGDSCTWYNDWTAQQNFVVNKGKTMGAPIAGPEGDSTGAYAGGYYAYLPGGTSNAGDAARLISPVLPPGTICFQAAYNMRGRQLGALTIYRNSDVMLRLRSGATGYEWRQIILTISSNTTFVLQIEAVRGGSAQGEIAIDDISVTGGPCRQNVNSPAPPSTYSVGLPTINGFTLLGHNMTLPIGNFTLISLCVLRCQMTPGCLSVNYNSFGYTCQLNNATHENDPFNFVATSTNMSYVPIVSQFKHLDSVLQNLCMLDSAVCTPSSNCLAPTNSNSSMLICQCQQPGISCYMPQDCQVALANGYQASGVYLIQPNATLPAVQVWCDMDVPNQKGYVVLVRRNNGGTRFHNRKLAEYQGFFGSPNGEYWLGLDYMSWLTNQFAYGYVIEGTLYNTTYAPIVGMSGSQPFVVANSANNYRLSLQIVGTMTSTMSSQTFSTWDSDGTGTNSCPGNYARAGWWYRTCVDGLFTGVYRPNEAVNATPYGMYVTDFGGSTGLTSVKLKIGRL